MYLVNDQAFSSKFPVFIALLNSTSDHAFKSASKTAKQ